MRSSTVQSHFQAEGLGAGAASGPKQPGWSGCQCSFRRVWWGPGALLGSGARRRRPGAAGGTPPTIRLGKVRAMKPCCVPKPAPLTVLCTSRSVAPRCSWVKAHLVRSGVLVHRCVRACKQRKALEALIAMSCVTITCGGHMASHDAQHHLCQF